MCICACVCVRCVLALGEGLQIQTCLWSVLFQRVVCLTSSLDVSLIPVAPADGAVGPHVQWSQAQAGHTVSPPSLWSPGPSQPSTCLWWEPQPTLHSYIPPPTGIAMQLAQEPRYSL